MAAIPNDPLLTPPTPVAVAAAQRQVYLVSVGQERRLTFWDMRQATPLNAITIGTEQLCISASSNGAMVAVGGLDCAVRVFGAVSGELIAECRGHSGHVLSVAFSPDDKQLVSTGVDGGIFVWNVYTDGEST